MNNKETTKKVELEYPVEVANVRYDCLTLRRMRAGDALIGEGTTSEVEAGYLLTAAICGVDVAVIKALDMEDFASVSEAMTSMLGKHGNKALEGADQTPSAGAT